MSRNTMIYHIADGETYRRQIESGYYAIDTLDTEGFIHCCGNEEDLLEVANFIFTGKNDLLVLVINSARLKSPLKWEKAPGDRKPDREFPHIYGPLNLDAVEKLLLLKKNLDQWYIGFRLKS